MITHTPFPNAHTERGTPKTERNGVFAPHIGTLCQLAWAALDRHGRPYVHRNDLIKIAIAANLNAGNVITEYNGWRGFYGYKDIQA